MSFIYRLSVIRKIFGHLGVYHSISPQRAQPAAFAEGDCQELRGIAITEVSGDGWPGYDKQFMLAEIHRFSPEN